MYFIYILQSEAHPDKTYVGFTEDFKRRLDEHNSGSQTYSHRYAPWRLLSYISFQDRNSALAFEKYLKSGSGKAFLTKHFLQSNPRPA
ncbi:MAG: GIY-YIG nuclease family protein [Verrucomicrobiota bacterium]